MIDLFKQQYFAFFSESCLESNVFSKVRNGAAESGMLLLLFCNKLFKALFKERRVSQFFKKSSGFLSHSSELLFSDDSGLISFFIRFSAAQKAPSSLLNPYGIKLYVISYSSHPSPL